MRKFLDGFYWGLGFSIALVFVFAIYTIVGHTSIERSYQRSMDELVAVEIDSFVDILQLEILDTSVIDNEILITTEMVNLGLTPNSLGLKLRFSLYNQSGEFMGQCIDQIPSIDSNEEKVHLLTTCKSKIYPVIEFHKATVAVSKR